MRAGFPMREEEWVSGFLYRNGFLLLLKATPVFVSFCHSTVMAMTFGSSVRRGFHPAGNGGLRLCDYVNYGMG